MKKGLLNITSFFILIFLINIFGIFIQDNTADLSEEGWTEDLRITNNNDDSHYPDIGIYENNVHIVWEDNRDGKYGVFYTKSEDNGTTWISPIKLNSDLDWHNMGISLDVFEKNIHVTWSKLVNNIWEIYYKKSEDNGDTWLPEKIISNNDENSSWISKIAIDNENICVVWGDSLDGNQCNEIYFRKSVDNGNTWSPIKRLTDADGNNSMPEDIKIIGNNIYIVWRDEKDGIYDEIYFMKSNDLGENWIQQTRITEKDNFQSQFASIAVNGSCIHIVWEDVISTGWAEIGYVRSIDGGLNWDKYKRLTSLNGVGKGYADIEAYQNIIHVIWTDDRDGDSEIYYQKSEDNGLNWGDETRLSDSNIQGSAFGRLTLKENNIYLTWEDYRDGNPEIYFKRKGNAPPKLSLGYVSPSYGNIFTDFYFNITYSDFEDDPPIYLYVNINGINYTMNETDKTDLIYSDGKDYYYETMLFKSESHTYRFYTPDGEYEVMTELFSGPLVDVGEPAFIEVSPSYTKISTDDYVNFSANIYDADGNLLNYWPEWKTSGGGTIDNSGNFTATRPGNWTIYSNISGISGTAIVDVTLGQLNQIIIFPSYSVITTDDNIQFYANGHDSDGNIIDIDPRWEVSGGGIIDGDGNFSATTPGNWTIYANDSGISSTAIIKIILGELKYISVNPSPLSMTTDDSMQFSANGYDSDKNLIDIEPNWDTTGGGTINETGYFDATRPGTWIIFANLSGVSGNAIVNITLGKLANLELNPPSPNINIGDSIKFSVTGYDADGNLVDIKPDWQVSGGGNIDQTGNFTAQEAGNWTVTVTYNGVSTSTNIIINPLDEEPDDGEEDTTISYTIIGIVVIMIFLVILLIFLFALKKKPIEELEDLEREQIIEE